MKKVLEGFAGIIVSIYMLGMMIGTPYYTWNDIQKNDSFIRYIFVSPIIGFLKSSVWPYYVYTDITETNSSQVTDIQNTNIKSFVVAQKYLNSAMLLARSVKHQKGDLEKIESLLEDSKKSILKCDRSVLNNLVDGWGDTSYDILLKSIEYSLLALSKDGDRSDLARSDVLLIDYKNWLKNNWIKIDKLIQIYR